MLSVAANMRTLFLLHSSVPLGKFHVFSRRRERTDSPWVSDAMTSLRWTKFGAIWEGLGQRLDLNRKILLP